MCSATLKLKPSSSGVGYGICQRLLFQLASPNPSDALPQQKLTDLWGSESTKELPISNVQGLTLIMACRSALRAEKARTELYAAIDGHVARQKRLPGYTGHEEKFRANLVIAIHSLDLASIPSIFRFGTEIAQKYVATLENPHCHLTLSIEGIHISRI